MSTTYDVYQKVLQVIDWLGQGQTETRACDDAGISIITFRKTVAADDELRELHDDAVQRNHDALADALINIDNHRLHGHSDPRMAGVISKNIQWYLSKADPRRFADRIEVKHELTMDRAIVDALMRAKDRTDLIEGEVIRSVPLLSQFIDAEVETVEEDEDTSWMLPY